MVSTMATETHSISCRQHGHVPKVFTLPDITPENKPQQKIQEQRKQCGSSRSSMNVKKDILQIVHPGEGKEKMTVSNLVFKPEQEDYGEQFNANDSRIYSGKLSLHRPILVRDSPESIGMKIPKSGDNLSSNSSNKAKTKVYKKKRKRTTKTSKAKNLNKNQPFSVRDVAETVGYSTRVQMIDVVEIGRAHV